MALNAVICRNELYQCLCNTYPENVIQSIWEYLKNYIIWALVDILISGGGDSAYLLNVVFFWSNRKIIQHALKKEGVYWRFVHVIAALPATLYLLYGLCFVLLRQNKAIFDQFCGLIIFGKADISQRPQTALIIKKKMLYKIPANRILYNIFR